MDLGRSLNEINLNPGVKYSYQWEISGGGGGRSQIRFELLWKRETCFNFSPCNRPEGKAGLRGGGGGVALAHIDTYLPKFSFQGAPTCKEV